MTSSILLPFKRSIAFEFGIIIATCWLVVPLYATDKFDKETKNCGESVDLSCYIENPRKDEEYWYHLSQEKLDKIVLNNASDQLHKHAVDLDMYVSLSRITLLYLSVYDSGLYACVDRSKGGMKVISTFWLEVTCNGAEKQNFIKQRVEKIRNGAAPPYIPFRQVTTWETQNVLKIENYFRGYPKPNNLSCTKNYKEHSLEKLPDSYELMLTLTELKEPTTISFSACNTNGCLNETIHLIYEPDNRKLVLEEVQGQGLQLCSHTTPHQGNSNSKWVIKKGKITSSTELEEFWHNAYACYTIQHKTISDEGIYELYDVQDSVSQNLFNFHLKLCKDRDTNAAFLIYLF